MSAKDTSSTIIGLLAFALFSGLAIAAEEKPEEEGSAMEEAEEAGSAASDPTAKVNFIDVRAQFFDLERGNDRDVYRIDGAYVFSPKFKAVFELHYWETDVTGRDRGGLAQYGAKGIYFPKSGEWRGMRYRIAAGAELIIDGDNVDKGIGPGADSIAPLFGVALIPKPGRTLIPFVQYFKSFDEEPGRDVEQTALRFIALQQLDSIKGWVKGDFKFITDHENDDKSSTTFEVQVGKMFTPKFGAYFEGLFALGGQKPHDDGFGIAGRFLF